MALQLTITLDNGLEVPNAYHRISAVSGGKKSMTIILDSYISQIGFTAGKTLVQQKTYTFTPAVLDNSTNFIKQGYEYIKILPEFKSVADVLETGQTA